MRLHLETYLTPCAPLLIVTDEQGILRALDFASHESRMRRLLGEHYENYELATGPAPTSLKHSLEAYFAGHLEALQGIPIATGGTPFQRAVWRALRNIKPGTTTTYGQIAARIGRPTASRAVGAANGSNPIAIVVPCHRVVGANRSLTGYAGGLPRKRWLLEHEQLHANPNATRSARFRQLLIAK